MVLGLGFLLLHHGSTGLGIQREACKLQLDNRGKSPKLQLCYLLQFVFLEQLLEDIMEREENRRVSGRVSLLLWGKRYLLPSLRPGVLWREIFLGVSLLGL